MGVVVVVVRKVAEGAQSSGEESSGLINELQHVDPVV
jgi:hypothetical protein